MSERAQTLAQRFDEELQAFIALTEAFTPEQWRQLSTIEGWPVGVVAHHVAIAFPVVTRWIQKVAAGRPVSLPRSAINEANAQHAQVEGGYAQADTIALLREHGAATAAYLRGLSDEELQQKAPLAPAEGQELSADQVIRHSLIHHIQEHKAHIQQALRQAQG